MAGLLLIFILINLVVQYLMWLCFRDALCIIIYGLTYVIRLFSEKYANITAGIVQQPFLKLKNGIVEGGEALFVIRRLNSGSGFDDCGNEKRFVNIDATAGLINNFHRHSSFL